MMQKYFKQLCLNKVQSKPIGEIIKSESFYKDECRFKPKVNNFSLILAEKHRQATTSGNTYIYKSMLEKMQRTNEWKLNQKQIKDKESLRECTFSPEIHAYSRRAQNCKSTMSRIERPLIHQRLAE